MCNVSTREVRAEGGSKVRIRECYFIRGLTASFHYTVSYGDI